MDLKYIHVQIYEAYEIIFDLCGDLQDLKDFEDKSDAQKAYENKVIKICDDLLGAVSKTESSIRDLAEDAVEYLCMDNHHFLNRKNVKFNSQEYHEQRLKYLTNFLEKELGNYSSEDQLSLTKSANQLIIESQEFLRGNN